MAWPPVPAKLFIAMTITIYLKPAIEGAELPPVARNPPKAEASQHRQPIYHNACATTKSPGQMELLYLPKETEDKA